MQSKFNKSQSGFSMIEILVTLVIVATALLGTAGLQIYAMRMGKSSHLRTQAIFLASDIAERMEANKPAAISGGYALASTSVAPALSTACTTGPCDSSALRDYDLNQWSNAVASLLPNPQWTITSTTTGNPNTYQILISWSEQSSDKSNHNPVTFSHTSIRTISN